MKTNRDHLQHCQAIDKLTWFVRSHAECDWLSSFNTTRGSQHQNTEIRTSQHCLHPAIRLPLCHLSNPTCYRHSLAVITMTQFQRNAGLQATPISSSPPRSPWHTWLTTNIPSQWHIPSQATPNSPLFLSFRDQMLIITSISNIL